MAKSPGTRKSPQAKGDQFGEPGALEGSGFSEAPQTGISGKPLTGTISDWAEQIEREALRISPLEGEMSPKATEGVGRRQHPT